MAIWKQVLLTALLAVVGAVVWAVYVPTAQPMLDRVGLLQPMRDLGLIADAAEAPDAGPPGAGNRSGRGVQVVAAPAREVVLNDVIAAIGSSRGTRSVTLQAEVAGQVMAIRAAPGDVVQAGQLVAELDSEAARIALDRAGLIRSDAQATSARVGALQARGAATDLQVQDAELALKTAELQYRQAEFELSRHRITAPIGGTIGLLGVEVGDRVSGGDSITSIEDQSSLIVDFRVPERIVSRLAPGLAVQVVPLAEPGRTLQGSIVALDNRVDEASRTLMVQAGIPNTDNRLRAGMSFSITLTFAGEAHPAVDPLAIQWGSAGSFVWVVREGKALQLPAAIVQRNADTVLIAADLLPGDQVVTEGVQALRPGAEVQVAPVDGAAVLLPAAQKI